MALKKTTKQLIKSLASRRKAVNSGERKGSGSRLGTATYLRKLKSSFIKAYGRSGSGRFRDSMTKY